MLEGPDGPVTGRAVQRPALAVLAILATSRTQRITRDRILSLVWPETDESRARSSLNVVLYEVRKALGEHAIESDPTGMRLNRRWIEADVVRFEEAVESDNWGDAVNAYGGDFLDGFHLRASVEFDDWLIHERERFARQYEAALEALAERAEASGDLTTATVWWQRRAETDLGSARLTLRLMSALDATGDRSKALQQAQLHAQWMKSELEAPPDPEVVAYAELLRGESKASGQSAPSLRTEGVARAAIGAVERAWIDASRRRRRALLAAIALPLAIVLVAQVLRPRRQAAIEVPTMLTMPLLNQTGDPELEPFGMMTADWIAQGLTEAGLARAVPAMMVLREQAIGEEGAAADRDIVDRLVSSTSARYVVAGSYYRQRDSLAIQVRVTDANTGELRRAIDVVVPSEDDPVTAIDALLQPTFGAIATLNDVRMTPWSDAVSQPPSIEAYRWYAEGLTRYFRKDMTESVTALRQAASSDPDFTAPLVWLVFPLRGVKYQNEDDHLEVQRLIAELVARQDEMPRWEQEMVDYHVAADRGDYQAAYEAMSRAVALAPGSERLWLLEGKTLSRLNRPQQVLDVLADIQPDETSLEQYTYWSLLAQSYHQLSDYDNEAAVIRRWKRALPDTQAPLFAELGNLLSRGETEAVTSMVQELMDPAKPLGMGIVGVWVGMLQNHGYDSLAEQAIDEKLTRLRRVPVPDRDEHWKGAINTFLIQAGRWDEAWASLAAEGEPDLGERSDHVLWKLGFWGRVAAHRGDRDNALRFERLLAQYNASRWGPGMQGFATMQRAQIFAVLGQRERAVELVRQALDQGSSISRGHVATSDLGELRGYPPYERLVQPR
jgi:DNA-binding SARP family transcriptional activator/TolB-like protein